MNASVLSRKSIQQVDRMVPVAEGTVLILKRGAAWSIQLTSIHSTSSLDCEPGWKNRRGGIGRDMREGAGLVTPETEEILDEFLALNIVVYVQIVTQSFLEIVLDRPVLPNDPIELDIVSILQQRLGWDMAHKEYIYA